MFNFIGSIFSAGVKAVATVASGVVSAAASVTKSVLTPVVSVLKDVPVIGKVVSSVAGYVTPALDALATNPASAAPVLLATVLALPIYGLALITPPFIQDAAGKLMEPLLAVLMHNPDTDFSVGSLAPRSWLPKTESDKPLNFIVIGDTGTGGAAQYQVSKAISRVCAQQSCMFVVGMGDNIYEYGPDSPQDSQFQSKFEAPYAGINLPFFMALGNHDQSQTFIGDGTAYWKGYHEVKYTQYSSKWKMPTRYYGFRADNKTSNAFFIAYDSNPMRTYLPQLNPYWWPKGEYMQKQSDWIWRTLKDNRATWNFAFAHHPYKTNADEGGSGPYWWSSQDSFSEQNLCGQVDFILAGHEHAMEVLDKGAECGGQVTTHMLISGAAAKTGSIRKSPAPNAYAWDTYNTQKYGFFLMSIAGKKLNLKAYTLNASNDPVVSFERTYTK